MPTTTKRNLLFVSAYTGLGGGEVIQLNLMNALDPDRYALHLVCPRDGQFPEAAREHGIVVHILPYRGITRWFVPAIWMRFPIARRLSDLAHQLGVHAIHSDYHSLAFAVTAGRTGRIPVIWNAMGWWYPAQRWQRTFFHDQVTQIISISRAVRDRWLAESEDFLPPERIKPIIPGVDPEYFHPGVDGSLARERLGTGPRVPLVAMLARFQHVKGHDVFQTMAKLVHVRFPEARFAVAGENVFGLSKDEAYKRAILTTAQEDPILRECLTYLGFWKDPRPVMAAADVIVCPSRFESLGMVHLESMAMARPVVSMNNGGPAETMLDGETGYLVPPEDPEALADRVVALLRDPARRKRMGEAGRARVLAHFTAAGYAQEFSQLVESLV
jgi:glycosyltransferase involved in cell wall biosynthesis